MGTVLLVIAVSATNANLQQQRFHAPERAPHQDSFASTPAEGFVPKDASLLKTDTLALEVHPSAMVSLSMVSLTAATSMTVVRWMVVWWMDVLWMDSVRLWAQMVLLQVLVSLLLVSACDDADRV